MTTTFCVPLATANWLLSKPGVLDLVHQAISDEAIRQRLAAVEFAEGPIRLLTSTDASLVILWHADYLSGTGDEDLGFIRLTGEQGLFSKPCTISREVLERDLYVINQRLEGLFIDGAFFHRSHANGAHTCAAGRGSEARQVNIGYVESSIATAAGSVKCLLCIGPGRDLISIANAAAAAVGSLRSMVELANRQSGPTRHRKLAPPDFLPDLRRALAVYFQIAPPDDYQQVSVATSARSLTTRDIYRTVGWKYSDWIAADSPLSTVQRRLLESDPLSRHPIRIVGPGGSGKTLLMQLLVMRQLEVAKQRKLHLRLLYLVHNAKMAEAVTRRFEQLGHDFESDKHTPRLTVTTLSDYARKELLLEALQVIDPDAQEAKDYQAEIVRLALLEVMSKSADLVAGSSLICHVRDNLSLQQVFIKLLMVEISTAIKGHGLSQDERKYVQSERRLSRFHGALTHNERRFVFEVFKAYHNSIFEENGVLDSDDIALSLLGRLRAPIWELKRKQLGFDSVFVDETQLFNENERRLFPLLTKTSVPHLPIALALDEAQDLYGQTSAGMGSLGIDKIANESLFSIHRSTKAIIQLAFFVIQRSTDLFGPDFPDFTGIAENMEADTHVSAAPPRVEYGTINQTIPKLVIKVIRGLRSDKLFRIGVICYSERYWSALLTELQGAQLPLRVLENRGERLAGAEPLVALSRPAHVGGQEFDAVILVGLEEGLIPPRVLDNDALAAAVEQQALRELYLGITRARFQVRVVLGHDATLTRILVDAKTAGLLASEKP